MVEPQLLEYIKKAREANQSDDKSRALLYQNGWTESEVNEAFTSFSATVEQVPPEQPAYQPPEQLSQVSAPAEQPVQQANYPEPETQTYQPQMTDLHQQPVTLGRKKSHLFMKLVLVMIVLVVVMGGGYFAITQTGMLKSKKPTVVSKPPVTVPVQKTPAPVFTDSGFATYNAESTKVTPALPDYKISTAELSNLRNFQSAGMAFSKPQTDAITKDNFFVAKNSDKFFNINPSTDYANRNDDWAYLYGKIGGSYNNWERKPENSVFITSDFLTHVYHKLLDEEFSYIEETNFYPTLDAMNKSLLKAAATAYVKESNDQQKNSFDRLSAYFLTASAFTHNGLPDFQKLQQANFLEDSKADNKANILAAADALGQANNVSPAAIKVAKQEIELIMTAKDMTSSPLMGIYSDPGMKEDYTQFLPRSHYAKNVLLRDYFRSMMFYGRMNFTLKSPQLTRDAENISLLMTADTLKQWESIYQPTSFFVGKADDLTIYDYSSAGSKTSFSTSVKDDKAISAIQNELISAPNPQIMSSVITGDSVSSTSKETLQNTTKGFRFMGQRFTPDAFIFSTLTQGDEAPDIKTGQKLPAMPTALMVPALMGSKTASDLLNTWIKKNASTSNLVLADKISTLQTYFTGKTQDDWTPNIYWSWLYTLRSLFTDSTNKTGFPMFMKTVNWNAKGLQTFLGSWTELKHDTLLYAKQSYAEMGAGGPGDVPPALPVPKGYVEPNIDFLDRLISLSNFTLDGLTKFKILSSNLQSRNSTFSDTLKFYRTIAVSELENQKITDEDFDKLRLSAGELDTILETPDSQVKLEKNARSAIIADVHTDVPDKKILYEADGIPNYIFVAVKDSNGTRLTKGLVYSYYEFTGNMNSRYTDDLWQSWEYSTIPQKLQLPWWSKALLK